MSGFFGKISQSLSGAYNASKNYANNTLMQVSKKLNPPPMQPQFQLNGKLSSDQFTSAGDKLTQVCTGWKWKTTTNPNYISKYLNQKKQYLILQDVHCYRRIKDIKTGKQQDLVAEDGQQIIVLHPAQNVEAEVQKQDYRSYKMYIIYDQHYHCPRMFFSANDYQGKPISNQDIKQDIQKQYLGATLTFQQFPFIQNCKMATVHPCKHANVLKTMADAMRENGQKIGAHYALLIFLKFITSVIPTVEFDITGDLNFQ